VKIFVAGGTGVLGRRVVKQLVADHDVTVVARTPERADAVAQSGATPASVDLFDTDAVARAVKGAEVVINLTTKIPSLRAAVRASAWRENSAIRTTASQNLAAGAVHGAARFIQESISMVYADGGGAWLDEASPFDDSAPPAGPVRAAESAASAFSAGGGTAVVLRFGLFYGPDTSHTKSQVALARRGLNPFLGAMSAYQSFVHVDDAASAVVAALALSAGTYSVAETEPATCAQRRAAVAAALGRRRLWSVPVPRAALGANGYLLNSLRVSSARLTATGLWTPRYPSPAEGWRQVFGELSAAGPTFN
jgi:nucleoside-diphosphate-sugar epimerase